MNIDLVTPLTEEQRKELMSKEKYFVDMLLMLLRECNPEDRLPLLVCAGRYLQN